jgi:hypothetical protein
VGGGIIEAYRYFTERMCLMCGAPLYGVADTKLLSSIMTFSDERLPAVFVGEQEELPDFLLCIRDGCRSIHELSGKMGIRKLRVVRCSQCLTPIHHANKLGYSEITCPTDGSKFMIHIGNPHIICRQIKAGNVVGYRGLRMKHQSAVSKKVA